MRKIAGNYEPQFFKLTIRKSHLLQEALYVYLIRHTHGWVKIRSNPIQIHPLRIIPTQFSYKSFLYITNTPFKRLTRYYTRVISRITNLMMKVLWIITNRYHIIYNCQIWEPWLLHRSRWIAFSYYIQTCSYQSMQVDHYEQHSAIAIQAIHDTHISVSH